MDWEWREGRKEEEGERKKERGEARVRGGREGKGKVWVEDPLYRSWIRSCWWLFPDSFTSGVCERPSVTDSSTSTDRFRIQMLPVRTGFLGTHTIRANWPWCSGTIFGWSMSGAVYISQSASQWLRSDRSRHDWITVTHCAINWTEDTDFRDSQYPTVSWPQNWLFENHFNSTWRFFLCRFLHLFTKY